MKYRITDNLAGAVRLDEIPEVSYEEFYDDVTARLADER